MQVALSTCTCVSLSGEVFMTSTSVAIPEVQAVGEPNEQLYFKAHDSEGEDLAQKLPYLLASQTSICGILTEI